MSSYLSKRRIRYNFGRASGNVSIPNLIHIQRQSYEAFLQSNVSREERKNQGVENALRSVFQIHDPEGRAKLEYVSYTLGDPKYTPEECIQRGVSYVADLKVVLRLIIWDCETDSDVKEISGIKEEEVHICDIPIMTDKGTFIINGAQRVVVSQLHRSPSVFYTHDGGKNLISGKYIYSARIIPHKGSWIDIEFDAKDVLYFRVDRKRKIPVTTLLRAIGYDKQKILKEFYSYITYKWAKDTFITKLEPTKLKGVKLEKDIIDAETKKVILKEGTRVTPKMVRDLQNEKKERYCIVTEDDLMSQHLYEDIVNNETGEIICQATDAISQKMINIFKTIGIKEIKTLDVNNVRSGSVIVDTLLIDKNVNEEQALADIYKTLRPGEPSTPEVAKQLFENTFFNIEKYDLSIVGRIKINERHNLDIPNDITVLTKKDIISVVKHLIYLKCGNGAVDDIDSLSNRRVRSVGELLETQFRAGLLKTQKAIIEKMSSIEMDNVMPHNLINSKALVASIKEFFGISQLSQFMDQTNPLAEVTHKRRLSALGVGGLTRERAGFEVRDVHVTHYGRICPIETPEGQNIGLINSLATYAEINKYGFIETPYRKVNNGYVTDEVIYLTALGEEKFNIANASIELDDKQRIVDEVVTCHRKGEVVNVLRDEVDLMDICPQQLISVAASLIPFLENDDANRALMGSNMQRQAVPLITNEAPLVGTGMEHVVARDSCAVIVAKRSGVVDQVDSKRIVIQVKEEKGSDIIGVDIYTLIKYHKSNQGTCIDHKPIVTKGTFVKKGDIIADGVSTDMGELALGKNILIAFMTWGGYNFEDSILISERLVKDDVYTSIHINEYEVMTRDTRLGPEEITRDIPNVNESYLKQLDEVGVVNIGANVNAGDILVGKITPKAESPLTPEEKLLRAIFGEKATDVRNSSLKMLLGEKGVVVDVKIFTRRGVQKDERAISIERNEIENFLKDKEDKVRIIKNYVFGKIKDLLVDHPSISNFKKPNKNTIKGNLFDEISEDIWSINITDKNTKREMQRLKEFYDTYIEKLDHDYKQKVKKLQSGDDLPQGVLKIVKVYVASKLKIQAGDKIAGRHGNKGVISKIAPVEDMPFLDDGQVVDIVLNPLGVPSRMNIGQVLETHLGWAAMELGKKIAPIIDKSIKNYEILKKEELQDKLKEIFTFGDKSNHKVCNYIDGLSLEDSIILAEDVKRGVHFASPVFDGAREEEISDALEKAGLDRSGQVKLRDGKTGEYFDRKVTVGYMYMMKLDHLVDKKMHARSIGPYSLVMQQPLGGKSHFGGQRFGEMECWALQAYGAAYVLQEMLTVKSDDIVGRVKAYESIVRGENFFDIATPESFRVMLKELRSLSLNVELVSLKE